MRTRSFTSTTQSSSSINKLDFDDTSAGTVDNPTQDTDVPTSLSESPIRIVSPLRRSRLHTLLPATVNNHTRKTKIKTPTKEAPVRSSPRLLKKRSFSCIGFSNSVPLKRSSSIENAPVTHRKVVTPNKEAMMSLTHSSPRIGKAIGTDRDLARESPQKVTPNKKALKTRTRSSPRLNHSSKLEAHSSKSSQPEERTIRTPRKHLLRTRTRSSPRLNKQSFGKMEGEASSNNDAEGNNFEDVTPKKGMPNTATRGYQQDSANDEGKATMDADGDRIRKEVGEPRNEISSIRSKKHFTFEMDSQTSSGNNIGQVVTPIKEAVYSLIRSPNIKTDHCKIKQKITGNCASENEMLSSPIFKKQLCVQLEPYQSSAIEDRANKKVVTPKKKILISSPGFNNQQSEISKDSEGEDEASSEDATPKKMSFTPIRSSPRLRKRNSNTSLDQTMRIPTRTSPRLSKKKSAKMEINVSDSEVAKSSDVTPKKKISFVPRRSSPRLKLKEKATGKESADRFEENIGCVRSSGLCEGSSLLFTSPSEHTLEETSSAMFEKQSMDRSVVRRESGRKLTVSDEVGKIVKTLDELGEIESRLEPNSDVITLVEDDLLHTNTKRLSLNLDRFRSKTKAPQESDETDRRKSDGDVSSRRRTLKLDQIKHLAARSLESVRIEPLPSSFSSPNSGIHFFFFIPTSYNWAL